MPAVCLIRRLIIWLTITGSCCALLKAQAARSTYRDDPEYLIDTWEAEDGLPENSATAITLGPDGFLWFGTWNGLVRFDGLELTVLDPQNTPGLPGQAIIHLHTDRRGRIWASTGNGLAVREGSTWRRCGTNEGWVGTYVRTFADHPNGDVLFTTFDGHVLECVGSRIRELPLPPGEPDQGYFGMVDAGRNWVLQNRFLGYFSDGSWVSAFPLTNTIPRTGVTGAAAQGGGFWALLGETLIRVRGGEVVRNIPLPRSFGSMWSMTEDSRSNLWLSTSDSGLVRLAADGGIRQWNNSTGLKALGIRGVVEDREGNLWVGTSGGGLTRFRPRRAIDASFGTQLADRHSRSVAPSAAGGLWIANSELGLYRQDGSRLSPVKVQRTQSAGVYGLSVLEDRAGRVWYGEKDGCWRGRADGEFEFLPIPWAKDVYAQSLFEDGIGQIWMGGSQGVARFDGKNFQTYGVEAGLPRSDRVAFAEDRQRTLWLAADPGLYQFREGRFTEVRTSDGARIPGVLCILPEEDGTVWLGTRTEGLWRWRGGRLDKLGAAKGYPVKSVHGILDDGLGYLWMPSQRGIVRVARADLHAAADGHLTRLDCLVVDRSAGLPSVECSTSQPCCGRDAAGRLWFATQRGVAIIHPEDIRSNPVAPQVEILRVNYQLPHDSQPAGPRSSPPDGNEITATAVRREAPFLEPLRLPPGSYGLEITYTAPSFSAPERVRFQTRLDGISEHWEDAGHQRLTRFAQLPPGHYTFRVRAANDDGLWNETGSAMAFTILPYYWQTRTFRIAVGLLLVTAGATLVFWRTRTKRRLELEEMALLRRRTAERERADKKFLLAVEASPNGILLTDPSGRIVLVNARTEGYFGYTRSELLLKPADVLLPERQRTTAPEGPSADRGAAESRATGQRRELIGRRKDGSEFPVEIATSPLETGEERLVLTSIIDITARKQSEEAQARQRNELAHMSRVTMLGVLAGSLAHELNQPLTSILSNAQAARRFLARESPDLDELRAILQDIIDEDQRAGEIIRRLRGLLKKEEEQYHVLDPIVLVQEALRLVRSDLLNQGVSTQLHLAPNTPPVLGDRVQLQQVLINLLINASEAMSDLPRQQRRLELRSDRNPDGSFQVSVSDHGPGIPADKLEEVFAPFYTTKSSGMGLGLSVCRTIIAAHRGRLWAAANPGGGATFHLMLPAVDRNTGDHRQLES